MKKICSLLLVTVLILAGCGGSDSDAASNNSQNSGSTESGSAQVSTEADAAANDTEASQEASLPGYVFTQNNVSFTVDMEAAPIIEALGEPASYFEAPSCAFEGLDKIYDYTSFEVNTYEMDGVDYISYIILKDDLVETPEGLSLFMTYDDMVAAYGDDFSAGEGLYTYEKDGMKLNIITSDSEIISIEYSSTFLD